jgi:hypothetical protein
LYLALLLDRYVQIKTKESKYTLILILIEIGMDDGDG